LGGGGVPKNRWDEGHVISTDPLFVKREEGVVRNQDKRTYWKEGPVMKDDQTGQGSKSKAGMKTTQKIDTRTATGGKTPQKKGGARPRGKNRHGKCHFLRGRKRQGGELQTGRY